MKTDYDKFCWALGEIDCKCTKYIMNNEKKSIEIDSENMLGYGGVGIEFDKDGKFLGFERYE